MNVEPIACWRPRQELAAEFASPPYDVFDRVTARSYVEAHPRSFLAIDRPETAFGEGQDPYAPEVYRHAVGLLSDRVLDGTLARDDTPCLYAYRLTVGDHSQTGIVAAVSVDDALGGVVRRHEQVREEKVADRMAHIDVTGAQTGPVLLAYEGIQALDVLIALACTAEPLYDFTAADGVRHTVWRIARGMAVESICAVFGQVETAYVADGHHRLEASVRLCQQARERGEEGARGSFLALLFPAGQVRVLAYQRVVADTNGLDEESLVSALESAGVQVGGRQEVPVEPAERGTLGMWAFGAWRELRFVDVPDGRDDPVSALDVAILQERVLGPVLGVGNPTADARISFVSAEAGMGELVHQAGEGGVAFALFPTAVADLMRVSDAGQLMPPKSTWFSPKPLSGLFLRRV